MAQSITMPSFGMYTSEGTLLSWLKPAGSPVALGEPVLEIETDKATHEVPAPAAGILHHVAAVGAALKEEAIVGYILAEGEKPPGASPEPSAPTKKESLPAANREASPAVAADAGGYIKASPLAKRLAAEKGLDLRHLKGSGPGGRIVEADILSAAAATGTAQSSTSATTQKAAAFPWKVRERSPLTGMRRTIAERLRHSVNTAVSLTLTREVIADVLVAARQRLAAKLGGSAPYDAYFIKLLAAGLREFPELNVVMEDNTLLLSLDEVNIGFAVAVPAGLLVPVVHGADRLSLREVIGKVRELTERARGNALKSNDLEGGTSTITNLGSFSVDAFTPILNPPQSSILGLGRIAPRAVVRDGQLAVASTCVLSLTFDHRVADGAPAARLLDAIARRMADEAYLNALAD